MKLPILYKKTSTGADQMWEISTSGSTIITRFGQVNGKIQEGRDEVKEGKNVGRSNETTPVQQAEAEAQSQWEKKLKKGYVESLGDARQGKVSSIIEGGYFPMLAHKYDERGDDITFPAYLQPKLDGHRCTSTVGDGDATLWSRTRKPIFSMPHICESLVDMDESFKKIREGSEVGFLLDGELYNHDYHNKFEELTHFIRSSKPEPGYEVVQYHVYDVNMPGPFSARLIWLQQLFAHNTWTSFLRLVKTIQVNNEEEMMAAFEEFNAQGYEGAIVRNAKGLYVEKRSADLQKLKTFQDAEFKIVGIVEGRGKLAGHALFTCALPDGSTFDVKMKGALENLKTYFDNPKSVIGRELTVKFQGYTAKGKPRFPVGWRFAEKL